MPPRSEGPPRRAGDLSADLISRSGALGVAASPGCGATSGPVRDLRPARVRKGRSAPGGRWLPAGAAALLLAAVGPGGPAAGEGRGSLRGHLETRPLFHLHEGAPERAVWGRALADWQRRAGGSLLFRARGVLEADWNDEGPEAVDRRSLVDGGRQDLQRPLVRLEELSLAWRGPHHDLAAGRMVIPWGRADGFNPTDNLTPFDSLDPLQTERLAAWAARGQLYLQRLTLEGAALLPETSRQPLLGTRWLPVPGEIDNPFHVPGVPSTGPAVAPAVFREGKREVPPWTLASSAWAVKADYRGGAWEGSLSHYDGWDDQIAFLPSPGAPAGPSFEIPVILDRAQPELRATGADLAWVSGRVILRAEAAVHRRGPPVESDFTFWIAELEIGFGPWRLIAAWADIAGEEDLSTAVPQLEQGALPAAIVRIGRDVATGVTFSAQLLANLNGDGSLARLEASWPLAHAFRLGAGLDVLEGPEGSFLGSFRDNDRLWARLRWSF